MYRNAIRDVSIAARSATLADYDNIESTEDVRRGRTRDWTLRFIPSY
jgi:hypothetical protein